MPRLIDLTGIRFGRLTVETRTINAHARPCWRCRCECGDVIDVDGRSLSGLHTKSCGCLRSDTTTKRNQRHGAAYRAGVTAEWKAWQAMKQRCYNANNPNYPQYGGRGIRVCERWLDDCATFLRDMGHRPPRFTLDRIEVNGDYTPTNCRWASRRVQSNNRRNNIRVTFDGANMTVSEVANLTGLDYAALLRRTTKEGQTADEAVYSLRYGRKRRNSHKSVADGRH